MPDEGNTMITVISNRFAATAGSMVRTIPAKFIRLISRLSGSMKSGLTLAGMLYRLYTPTSLVRGG